MDWRTTTSGLLSLPLLLLGCGDSTGMTESETNPTATGTTSPSTVSNTTPPGGSDSETEGTTSPSGTETGTASSTGTTDPTTGPGPTTDPSATDTDPTTGPDPTSGTGPTTGPDPTTGTTGEPIDECKVIDDMDAIGECSDEAPPDSFEPEIQWDWTGPNGDVFSIVTPLVANLTDDDDNGEIDLCDIPDIVVVSSPDKGFPNRPGHIYVLDGETGVEHFQIPTQVDHTVTPAIGDIDDDGIPEIVSAVVGGQLIAFEHDGTLKWQSNSPWPEAYSGAIALADLDNDGDIEIVFGNRVADHNGALLWTAPQPAGNWSATTAADLDNDDDLEVVLGHAAYHHDGSLYYQAQGVQPGYPTVADFDDDGMPEVVVNNSQGLTMLEHDGTIVYTGLRPTGDPPGFTTWLRPSTAHDFDADGFPEYAVSSANNYSVYQPDATIEWSAPVSDQSGIAAGTAFDFLGDGSAEAMYADENFMFVFDNNGQVLLQIERTSGTLSEYPIVADIDNDGSAEIVVVSNQLGNGPTSPTVQVIRDIEDRWIQARRIWNQHTYHVTNVREDGTIPQVEPHAWEALNTFRTNAQIEGGGLCMPTIE